MYDLNPNLNGEIVDIQSYPENIDKYITLPFSKFSALGAGVAALASSFESIPQNIANTSGLYSISLPNGISGALTMAKDGNGYRGYVHGADGIVAQARLHPVENVNASAITYFNPATFFMAIAIMEMDQKLDEIKKAQQDILNFLERDKISQLLADLELLNDMASNYKYFWNNDSVVMLNMTQTKDILRNARKDTLSYYKLIEEILSDGKNNANKFNKLMKQYDAYKLASYVYVFSSFLDVMLAKNFKEEYLDKIINTLRDYMYQYRVLYTKCYDAIENFMKTSAFTQIVGTVAKINKSTGETIAKLPIINKTKIDEILLSNEVRIKNKEEMRIGDTLKRFVINKDNQAQVFIEKLETMNRMYNKPIDILWDKENIYLKQ